MSAMFESELLELARIVLDRAGFSTEAIEVSSGNGAAGEAAPLRLLLAQDAFFVVAVAAGVSVGQLAEMEEAAVLELTRRSEVSQLGAKQWDLYLVLLASQPQIEGEASVELVSLRQNTRLVRRLAHAGVQPTIDDLSRVLRPFLPLPQVTDSAVLVDALVLLEEELVAAGIDGDVAGRAVAAFREGGSLSSV